MTLRVEGLTLGARFCQMGYQQRLGGAVYLMKNLLCDFEAFAQITLAAPFRPRATRWDACHALRARFFREAIVMSSGCRSRVYAAQVLLS
mmetsp:Transcript_104663/g.263538  ORF Transcript_104663/g.263538 Transcript_104663/m.263538 type:complete len:90 (-) Transcript_104663:5-274(-)